jgi:hypothetical protein
LLEISAFSLRRTGPWGKTSSSAASSILPLFKLVGRIRKYLGKPISNSSKCHLLESKSRRISASTFKSISSFESIADAGIPKILSAVTAVTES